MASNQRTGIPGLRRGDLAPMGTRAAGAEAGRTRGGASRVPADAGPSMPHARRGIVRLRPVRRDIPRLRVRHGSSRCFPARRPSSVSRRRASQGPLAVAGEGARGADSNDCPGCDRQRRGEQLVVDELLVTIVLDGGPLALHPSHFFAQRH